MGFKLYCFNVLPIIELDAALQAATILLAMASGKKNLATKILAKVTNFRLTD